MGDTISSLVFRPPKPTPIHPSDYFYLDVDVYSPLCTNKVHLRRNNRDVGNGNGAGDGNGNGNGDCCGSFVVADDDDHAHGGGCGVGIPMCLETGESDLASLDNSFIGRRGDNSHHNNHHLNVVGGCYTGEACSSPRGRGDDANNANAASSSPSPDVVRNVRDGQVYRIPAFFIRRRLGGGGGAGGESFCAQFWCGQHEVKHTSWWILRLFAKLLSDGHRGDTTVRARAAHT